MEKRIIELEKKTAFQDQMLEELNEVIIAQQKQIGEIEKQFAFLKDHLMSGDLVKKQEEENPPPHY